MDSMMTTRRIKFAVSAYIKCIELSSDIPDVIKDLIFQFAKYFFNWKHSKCVLNAYKFYDKDPGRLIRAKRGWAFLVVQEPILLNDCRRFIWELELAKIKHVNMRVNFMFGFVESPIKESINNKQWKKHFAQEESTKSRQFGIYVDGTCRDFRRWGRRDTYAHRVGSNVTDKWRESDRFKLILDCKERKVNLFYNEKDMGVVYRELPDKIHAAISVYYPAEFVCTKYYLES